MALFLALATMSACADWPDVDTPRPTRASVAWPELIPISTLPPAAASQAEEDANEQLLRRASALRARAAILRRPVPDSDAFERLRARLAR